MLNKKGFTLIELICAIALLGVLLFIAVPEIKSTRNKWVVDSIAKQIVQDIRWTQHLARTEGAHYDFDVNTGEGTYRIRSLGDQENIKNVELSSAITSITTSFQNKGIYDRLSFTPTGIPSQTGTIYLITADERELKITVAVGTGRVVIVP